MDNIIDISSKLVVKRPNEVLEYSLVKKKHMFDTIDSVTEIFPEFLMSKVLMSLEEKLTKVNFNEVLFIHLKLDLVTSQKPLGVGLDLHTKFREPTDTFQFPITEHTLFLSMRQTEIATPPSIMTDESLKALFEDGLIDAYGRYVCAFPDLERSDMLYIPGMILDGLCQLADLNIVNVSIDNRFEVQLYEYIPQQKKHYLISFVFDMLPLLLDDIAFFKYRSQEIEP